jgi:hypothetical protein
MTDIRTRIRVDPDHRISGTAPAAVPPGEHAATITVTRPSPPEKRAKIADLPIHDIPWDGSISLRRENMYTDDGS